MHYFPITLPFLLIFGAFLLFMIVVIEVGILQYAYQRIGVGHRHMFALLALSFFGSYVNIPIFQMPAHPVISGEVVTFHGMDYMVPFVQNWPGTVIAVNIGGAVVPFFLSLYLVAKNRIYGRGILGTAIVAALVYLMAYPVRGVGIAVPTFFPPLIATIASLLLSRAYAPPLAYICGSMGTLIGADILNLDKIAGLGAPVASIGGAGTFDGIFLTGVLSVLLASLFSRRRPMQ